MKLSIYIDTYLYIQHIYTRLKFKQTSQIIFEVVNDIPDYKYRWGRLGVTGDSGGGVGGTGNSCGSRNVEDTDDSGGESHYVHPFSIL